MALEGTLRDMALVDLFEVFQLEKKSGILHLSQPQQHGLIYVTRGRLIDATVYDTLTQQLIARGDDAALQMLRWDAADFTFSHDSSLVRHPVTIYYASDQLVRLSAAPLAPAPHAAQPLDVAMQRMANLAFSQDLDPAAFGVDRQESLAYRGGNFLVVGAPRKATQAFHAPARRLELMPLAAAAQNRTQPAQPLRKATSPAGRNLLAAVLRHIRAL